MRPDEIQDLKSQIAEFQDYIDYIEIQISNNEDPLLFVEWIRRTASEQILKEEYNYDPLYNKRRPTPVARM